MKALFVTTHTNDTHNHIDAWDAAFSPASRIHFNYRSGVGTDAYILNKARDTDADVIFYIGCNRGAGLPSFDALRELRKKAPLVNIISDAADKPWHHVIAAYREKECFDLHVGIDGDPQSPVDLVTLTPVDHRAFDAVQEKKEFRCGFSGNLGGKRTQILSDLGSRCLVRVRGDDYEDHIRFLKRCRMVLNISFTGSGDRHHIKGRVTEAGYAGAALLESRQSPIRHWFPASAFLAYTTTSELRDVIDSISDDKIESCAQELSRIVREKYTAEKIYGEILERVGLTEPVQAA